MTNCTNSGAARWCTAAKPTVDMSHVWRWLGRCSGSIAAMVQLHAYATVVCLSVRVPMRARSGPVPYDVLNAHSSGLWN